MAYQTALSEPKQRVFVSSVIDGFQQFRQAARQGILAAGGEPVLVNEDFPSMAASSRNVCLDAVASCDYLLSIVGERGGWTAPSGKLVVEEEFEEAAKHKIPVFAFVQAAKRDADGDRFEKRLSEFVHGGFRTTFNNPDELRSAVESALAQLLSNPSSRRTMQSLADYFLKPYSVPQTTMLRFVLMPVRDEEVIDPVRLRSTEFLARVYEIGHSLQVHLFSYERPKNTSVESASLLITQTNPNSRHGEGEHVRLQMAESGDLVIDVNVTGRVERSGSFGMGDSAVVPIEAIEEVMGTCFAFTAALYDDIDRFGRHQQFGFNVALSGLGYRTLERNPQPRSSYTMSMRNGDSVVVAHDEPRIIGRSDLKQPVNEIGRAIVRLGEKARP